MGLEKNWHEQKFVCPGIWLRFYPMIDFVTEIRVPLYLRVPRPRTSEPTRCDGCL